ncbi:Gustatory receptor, partial [Trinorchestia longiramus]
DTVEVIQTCIFYCFGATGALLLLRASPVFVHLCDRWCRVEAGVGNQKLGRRWPFFLGLLLLALSALWETSASMIYRVQSTPQFWSFLEIYIKESHIEVVHTIGYSKPLGILILMINKYATFIWNFVDLFVATIAYVLARHFKAFNQKLQRKCEGTSSASWSCGEYWWRGAREQHLHLQKLVEDADAVTGPLVLQSFVCNLFFMLVQLYNGLRPHHRISHIGCIYLVWSFLHLLCRLLFVSFTCASLHTETLKPTTLLLSLPTESVNTEVKRFMKQLLVRSVGMTGCGFFFVNKSFILATTGVLITYEVILLQLNPS